MKVGVNGGAAERFAPSGLPEGHTVYVRLQWNEFPHPVQFDDDQIRYQLVYEEAPAPSQRKTKEMTFDLP